MYYNMVRRVDHFTVTPEEEGGRARGTDVIVTKEAIEAVRALSVAMQGKLASINVICEENVVTIGPGKGRLVEGEDFGFVGTTGPWLEHPDVDQEFAEWMSGQPSFDRGSGSGRDDFMFVADWKKQAISIKIRDEYLARLRAEDPAKLTKRELTWKKDPNYFQYNGLDGRKVTKRDVASFMVRNVATSRQDEIMRNIAGNPDIIYNGGKDMNLLDIPKDEPLQMVLQQHATLGHKQLQQLGIGTDGCGGDKVRGVFLVRMLEKIGDHLADVMNGVQFDLEYQFISGGPKEVKGLSFQDLECEVSFSNEVQISSNGTAMAIPSGYWWSDEIRTSLNRAGQNRGQDFSYLTIKKIRKKAVRT